MSPSSIYVRILTGLILCRSCADNQSHCELLSAMAQLSAEDIVTDVFPNPWSLQYLFPLSYNVPVGRGCDTYVPLRDEHVTVTHFLYSDHLWPSVLIYQQISEFYFSLQLNKIPLCIMYHNFIKHLGLYR